MGERSDDWRDAARLGAAEIRPSWRKVRRWGAQVRPVALAILIMLIFAMLDLLTTAEFVYLPLLSLGPAFAAIRLPAAQVVLVGCIGIGLWFPMVSNDGLIGSHQGYIALLTIIGTTAAGAGASVARQRRERELADVRAVADVAEQVLLRPAPAQVGEVQLAARYVSAAASARIGGDVYDVIPTGQLIRIILGDVQGKGLPAVKAASVVLGAFRETAYDAPGLAEIARRIELSLQRQAPGEGFVTAVLAQVRLDGTAIEILNCGHPPPLLVSASAARFAEPPEPELPLGLADLAVTRRKVRVLPLSAGDQLLFYTDGISESRDGSGAFYPLEGRFHLLGSTDPEEALARLSADVVRHAGGDLRDDAAMLLLRRSLEKRVSGRW